MPIVVREASGGYIGTIDSVHLAAVKAASADRARRRLERGTRSVLPSAVGLDHHQFPPPALVALMVLTGSEALMRHDGQERSRRQWNCPTT
jgi:hypothetical protein